LYWFVGLRNAGDMPDSNRSSRGHALTESRSASWERGVDVAKSVLNGVGEELDRHRQELLVLVLTLGFVLVVGVLALAVLLG
jgi:hypothetical protein